GRLVAGCRFWTTLNFERQHVIASKRDRLRDAGSGHVWKRLEIREQSIEEGAPIVLFMVRRLRQRNAKREHVVCTKPGVHMSETAEAGQKKGGANQQDDRQRNFEDQQSPAHPSAAGCR